MNRRTLLSRLPLLAALPWVARRAVAAGVCAPPELPGNQAVPYWETGLARHVVTRQSVCRNKGALNLLANGKELLSLGPFGHLIVRGRPASNDCEVVGALLEWMEYTRCNGDVPRAADELQEVGTP